MTFIRPYAEYLTMYHVETREGGVEYIPQEVCGDLCLDDALDDVTEWSEAVVATLRPYLEGYTIESIEVRTGWYGRPSANGYLDCTHWIGIYEEYECNENGDDVSDEQPITRREGT